MKTAERPFGPANGNGEHGIPSEVRLAQPRASSQGGGLKLTPPLRHVDLEAICQRFCEQVDERLEFWLGKQEQMLDRVLLCRIGEFSSKPAFGTLGEERRRSCGLDMTSKPAPPEEWDNTSNEKDGSDKKARFSQGNDATGSGRQSDRCSELRPAVSAGGAPSGSSSWLVEQLHPIDGTRTTGRLEHEATLHEFMRKKSAENESVSKWRACLRSAVRSPRFESLFSSLVFLSSILLGVQVDYTATHPDAEPDDEGMRVLMILNYVLSGVFFIEIVLRILAEGRKFFGLRKAWNYLDFAIVATSLLEVAIEIALSVMTQGSGGTSEEARGSSGLVRMLRLLRLTRLLRLVRTARQFRSLRLLVYSIMSCFMPVFWAMVLLFSLIYGFAIIFTQAVGMYMKDFGGKADIANSKKDKYFGSLPSSMFSLLAAVSNGVGWETLIFDNLSDVHAVWVFVFLIYMILTYFAMLNVVTGVFCSQAIEGAEADHDQVLQNQVRLTDVYIQRAQRLFAELDYKGDGKIAVEVFRDRLKDRKVATFFRALDVDTNNFDRLFTLLDPDHSGEIEVTEFIDGCLRFRGSATKIDIELILRALDELRPIVGKSPQTGRSTTYAKVRQKLTVAPAVHVD